MFFWASGGRSKANVLNLFSFPISLSGLYYYPALSVFGELFFSFLFRLSGKTQKFLVISVGGFFFQFLFLLGFGCVCGEVCIR